MLHRSILVTAVLLTLTTASAWGDSPGHAWSFSFGSDIFDAPTAIATDDFGNTYVTGYFQNSMMLGGFPLTSSGGTDIFLVKFSPNGNVLWAQQFGDALSDYALAIDCDGLGYTVITGRFWGTIDFGGGVLSSAGNSDIFVAKFSPTGNHIWSMFWGDPNEDVATSIALDNAGNVFFTGYFYNNLTLGGAPLVSAGAKDIFLAKLDPTGGNLWALGFGGAVNDDGTGVAIDNAGNVVLAANGQSPMNFGGGVLTPTGSDIFLSKFDTNGIYQWAYNYGGAGSAIDGKVQVDGLNNIVLAGHAYSGTDMGGGVLPISGITDVIVAKYSDLGAHIWSYNYGGSGFDFAFALTLDSADGITVSGYYNDTASFGGTPMVSKGQGDIYVAHYASDGSHQWSTSYGGLGQDSGKSLATDASGNLILFATFEEALSVGASVLFSNGNDDAMLVKYYGGPTIHSVLDVPGDQGGLVNVAWYANGGDNVFDQDISWYSVWRAIDAGAAMAMVEKGAVLIEDPAKVKSVADGQGIVRAAGDYFWYQMASVSAIGLEGYSTPVATLFDSTGATPQGHYFQVIAHTFEPYRYYVSAPDTGYSVDNLAPAPPMGLAAAQQLAPDGLKLTWDANSEADLAHYEVYRGTDAGFVIDGGSFLSQTPDTTTLDSGWSWDSGYWYKVVAVDVHGNKSPYALIGPDLVSDAGGEVPAATRLDQNVPNPFNPTTSIKFSLVEAGDVTLRVYNATGQLVRTLVDGHRAANAHAVTWDGRDDRGQMVASGVYFYRLKAGAFAQTRKMVLLK